MSEKTPMETLSELSTAMDRDSAAVTAVRIDDPVGAIESSLSEFVRDSFQHVQENRKFETEVREAILVRLSEANVKQLMDFYSQVQVNNTGATSSLVTPIMGMQAARVQAEIETHTLPGSPSMLDEKVSKRASKDVLQGIVQLNQLLEAMHSRVAEVEVVDDKTKKS